MVEQWNKQYNDQKNAPVKAMSWESLPITQQKEFRNKANYLFEYGFIDEDQIDDYARRMYIKSVS